MKPAPRVVLDTNVVLSALLFAHGRLARLRGAWQQEAFHPLASQITIEELVRALAYPKFELSTDDQRELLADYLPYCIAVKMPSRPPRTPACRDPSDVAFLELAIVAKADWLVNGDRDLLAIQGRMRTPIITPDAFLGSLEKC